MSNTKSMMRLSGTNVVWLTLGLALILSGCGKKGLERVVVYGKVTYAGKPIADGSIRFRPTGETTGPLSYGIITAGEYRLDTLDGVPLGTHRVEIQAFDPAAPVHPGPDGFSRVGLLPQEFNKRSQLETTLEPGQSSLERNFDLEGPPIPKVSKD